MTLTESIKREARAVGFQAVGISRVTASSDDPGASLPHCLESRLREWLARGYHGLMAWMERDPDRRADPRRVLPGCRSVISVAMNYFTGHGADEVPATAASPAMPGARTITTS